MTSSERHAEIFDRAMVLRDEGQYPAAIAVLIELIAELSDADQVLLKAHSLVQLAYLYKQTGDCVDRELHLRRATEIAPRFELASLSLFLALIALDRREDAFREMLRYVALKASPGYRELLSDEFMSGLSPEERALAEHALGHLDRWT